ncbi:MAG: hypothetical protein LBF81_01880 [Prevotellaceae bacterium]|nr:hypothetical protein [Prevotellaceae bacterium]
MRKSPALTSKGETAERETVAGRRSRLTAKIINVAGRLSRLTTKIINNE